MLGCVCLVWFFAWTDNLLVDIRSMIKRVAVGDENRRHLQFQLGRGDRAEAV